MTIFRRIHAATSRTRAANALVSRPDERGASSMTQGYLRGASGPANSNSGVRPLIRPPSVIRLREVLETRLRRLAGLRDAQAREAVGAGLRVGALLGGRAGGGGEGDGGGGGGYGGE